MTITLKRRYGYVGPLKRSSTSVKVDGITHLRVFEHQHFQGIWCCELTINGGRNYFGSIGTHFKSREEAEQAAVSYIEKDYSKPADKSVWRA